MNLLRDLHYGVGMLFRNRALTLAAIITLAIGIGANTTVFSLVDALMFRPMTVKEPASVVRISGLTRSGQPELLAYADYRDLAAQATTLSAMAAANVRGFPINQNHRVEMCIGEFVSTNYFDVMGVQPVIGRGFLPGEETPHAGQTVGVISWALWQRYFNGDLGVIGKTYNIRENVTTIVGVAPRNFQGIEENSDVWLPAIHDTERGFRAWVVIGRLKPGVTPAQAQSEMTVLVGHLAAAYPNTNKDAGALVTSEKEKLQARLKGLLPLVLVGLVLVIACATVQNLLLARAEARQREIAVRAALGATRSRLAAQMLVESVLLAALGAGLGLGLAHWLIEYLPALMPSTNPLHTAFEIDGRVLLFTAAASCASVLLFGLVPALRGSRINLVDALKSTAHAPLPGFRRLTLRDALVAAQVGLSTILLVCSALLIQSLLNLHREDLGFEKHNMLVAEVLPAHGMQQNQYQRYYDTVLERTAAVPGVTHAALTLRVPLSESGGGMRVRIYTEGLQLPPGEDALSVRYTSVSHDYFAAAGTRLLRGRTFSRADTAKSPRVIILNQSLARNLWPGDDPIGKHLRKGGPQGQDHEVVGVVEDSKYMSVQDTPEPFVYLCLTQFYWGEATLVARTAGSPLPLRHPIAQLLKELNPDGPSEEPLTVEEHIANSIWMQRALAKVVVGFGVLALLLTCVGIYGVISYSVNRRLREIGVRLALGARPASVLSGVIARGMTLCLIGASIGTVAGLVTGRFLRSFLYGVAPAAPSSFMIALAIIAVVSLAACAIPARRASRVDPAIALRTE